ncbi:hypothetical protein HU200_005898 [Digitaria exilis]|uniref:Uncharacterized protein n=1 Tax=Digitaria exilis TaxID=1010633 RepID=A0A835FQT6_9POAL|nr:hypothetical protein HU200_005898 [Digitaria exilis]
MNAKVEEQPAAVAAGEPKNWLTKGEIRQILPRKPMSAPSRFVALKQSNSELISWPDEEVDEDKGRLYRLVKALYEMEKRLPRLQECVRGELKRNGHIEIDDETANCRRQERQRRLAPTQYLTLCLLQIHDGPPLCRLATPPPLGLAAGAHLVMADGRGTSDAPSFYAAASLRPRDHVLSPWAAGDSHERDGEGERREREPAHMRKGVAPEDARGHGRWMASHAQSASPPVVALLPPPPRFAGRARSDSRRADPRSRDPCLLLGSTSPVDATSLLPASLFPSKWLLPLPKADCCCFFFLASPPSFGGRNDSGHVVNGFFFPAPPSSSAAIPTACGGDNGACS